MTKRCDDKNETMEKAYHDGRLSSRNWQHKKKSNICHWREEC